MFTRLFKAKPKLKSDYNVMCHNTGVLILDANVTEQEANYRHDLLADLMNQLDIKWEFTVVRVCNNDASNLSSMPLAA